MVNVFYEYALYMRFVRISESLSLMLARLLIKHWRLTGPRAVNTKITDAVAEICARLSQNIVMWLMDVKEDGQSRQLRTHH